MPDWLNIILRSVFFLILLFSITKWLGKKQISQLSFFEYVNGITIGNIGAEVVTGLDQRVSLGLISMLTIAALPFLAGLLSLKSKKFRDIVEGKGTIFIKDGKILEENLKKERYTTDELLTLLRKKNVYRAADVEFAVLEATGDFNVMLKKENQPLTPKDLSMKFPSVKEPQTVIMDGEILDESLAQAGRSRGWLHTELEKLGVTIENVFLGQVDSYGQLTVDLFDDKIEVPSPQEMPLLYATLKKCQADLELFALGTENTEAKKMYSANSKKIQDVVDKVGYILKE
ncbi:DUF421 domain-containing protein [Peribacillus asahii]|uniref:DUF421 domain-containing protein n=1 Tax=Peribacillus asahii TaxID=228899 RepID=A0A398B4X0_9BACI|nr:DUF421 domain-containing protein [Peribacillus asahii]RID85109.1 DUF421 domain-containing protein [Peribacillus asahii]